jgi:hypothetical protein
MKIFYKLLYSLVVKACDCNYGGNLCSGLQSIVTLSST